MSAERRIGLYCGVAAPVVSLLSNLLASLFDPEFRWTDKALSDLGRHPEGKTFLYAIETSQAEFFLFNGGLLLTAVLGLGFAWVLFENAENFLEQAGVAVYALALVMLGAVAVFHLPHALHGAVAIAYFLLAPLSLLCYGIGQVLDGRPQYGLVTVGAGVGFVLSWLVWGIWLSESAAPGIAIPEFASAIFFSGWSFGVASTQLWSDQLAERADGYLDWSA